MSLNILRDFERYLYTRDLSSRTVEVYLGIASRMEEYFKKNYDIEYDAEKISNLRGYMVSNWATSIMELKIRTRILYLTTANMFLKYLYFMQYVNFNLASALPPIPSLEKYQRLHPGSITPKRNYSSDELKSMMDSFNRETFCGSRGRALIATLVSTGLRVTELASLNVGDVTNGSRFVMVARKGTHGNKVSVPFPSSVMPYIQSYLQLRRAKHIPCDDSDPLFVSSTGKRLGREYIYEILSKVQRDTGCPTGVHTFRHTALTQLAKDADPIVSRDVAGQKHISITNQYLHSSDDEMLQATEKLISLLGD